MTQSLELDGSERVLEIGTGSGYQTAVLSQLCREVVTVERLEELAVRARQVLAALGVENVHYRFGDGTLGCPEFALYDGIIVTAGSPAIPEPLFRQLKPGGRMIIPVGEERRQKLLAVENRDGEVFTRAICDCSFVKLIGAAGWPSE
jgi:protein-L-isoaspartate(D-aspartate) O-methyltransferase